MQTRFCMNLGLTTSPLIHRDNRNVPKPPDAIRRKIALYVEGSPEEVAKSQQAMEDAFLHYPESLSLPREGSLAGQWMWPNVKANLQRITDPWVVVSQAFIDPVSGTEHFPDLSWGGMWPPD